jgi:phage terminase large subunit-like protein
MAPGEANAFEYDWRYRARPEQLPPAGSWRIWLLMAGRGFGKTRCGAEWVRAEARSRAARSLAPAFFEQIIRKYESTRLGRQERPGCGGVFAGPR